MRFDLDTYSRQAEQFVGAIDREYYLHFSGQKDGYEIEPIYDRFERLFESDNVGHLRDLAIGSTGDASRRLRYLLRLTVEGLLGRATKAETAELAEREATLEVQIDDRRVPFRQTPVLQANEPNSDRRAEIETARMQVIDYELNPLLREVIERVHAISHELGWISYREMCEQLFGLDLTALERQTSRFSAATAASYRSAVEPSIEDQLGFGFDRLTRADMARFFRAPRFDELFPGGRLIESFDRTLAALGFDPREQPNVTLDLEQRPLKSPRAFCSPVRVPQEIYLVIPRNGGREDYAALFHEGGHTEHYANVDPSLAFEFRHLGDNSVTESFAFLFEHLTEDPAWLRRVLGIEPTPEYLAFARASRLIYLRRYAAKLSYELELHGSLRTLDEMPGLYAMALGKAVGVDWPSITYLADVDDGFYTANYLRAWALETHWRKYLRERFGELWFEQREAGDFLRSLWAEGQRLGGDELLRKVLGEQLDFDVMRDELSGSD